LGGGACFVVAAQTRFTSFVISKKKNNSETSFSRITFSVRRVPAANVYQKFLI